jgi:membrane protein DedA with SNARE-associated domain
MSLDQLEATVVAFLRDHQSWAPIIVLVLAFGESLAFISLLLPATVIVIGVGALIGVGDFTFWPLWLAAAAGAFLGDWLSYVIGLKLGWRVAHIWPLNRHPELLKSGHRFFERWGVWSIFIGRFFGPLRAIVPLIAGICGMSQFPFMIGNLASALIWAAGVLAPGAFGLPWIESILR